MPTALETLHLVSVDACVGFVRLRQRRGSIAEDVDRLRDLLARHTVLDDILDMLHIPMVRLRRAWPGRRRDGK